MNTHYIYLYIDIAILMVPVIVTLVTKKMPYRSLLAMLGIGYCYMLMDSYLTQWGVMAVNPDYVLGPKVAGLPIEQWLFYIATAYAGVIVYNLLIEYTHFHDRPDRGANVLLVAGIMLVDAGLFFRHRAYTLVAFELCGITGILVYIFRNKFKSFRVDIFLFTFLLGLMPFLVIDGILTYLQVVVYSSSKITGIHLLSIPIEDIFYGMPLLLINLVAATERPGQHERRQPTF